MKDKVINIIFSNIKKRVLSEKHTKKENRMKKIYTVLISTLIAAASHSAFAADNSVNQAEWIPKLDEYLQTGKFASAREITTTQPAAAVLERLKPWAEMGLTPAQWMYAETMLRSGRNQESADWTYISFFNTRLDAALCSNVEAKGLEKAIVSSFNRTVQAARVHPEMMTQAIINTIQFQKSKPRSYIANKHPEWLCLMVFNRDKNKVTVPTSQWGDIYQQNLDSFTAKTKGSKDQVE